MGKRTCYTIILICGVAAGCETTSAFVLSYENKLTPTESIKTNIELKFKKGEQPKVAKP